MNTIQKIGAVIVTIALTGIGIYTYYKLIKKEYVEEYPETGKAVEIRSTKMEFRMEKDKWSFPILNAPSSFEADLVPGREVRYDGDDKRKVPWPIGKHFSVPTSVRFIEVRSTETYMTGAGIPYK